MLENLFNRLANYFAFSLLFLAPFISFLKYNDYVYWRIEALIPVIGLIVLGLIFTGLYEICGVVGRIVLTAIAIVITVSFFSAWQSVGMLLVAFFLALLFAMLFLQYSREVLSIVFAVFILAVLVFPMAQKKADAVQWQKTVGLVNNKLPPIIYLILDEHGGAEGLPVDTPASRQFKRSLQDRYKQWGFHLFGNAYSHYANTYNSIPNLLNFTAVGQDDFYFSDSGDRRLKQNIFFSMLAKQGYQFRIYQPGDYIDYCAAKNVSVTSCYSFPTMSLGLLMSAPLSVADKLSLLTRDFLWQSSAYHVLRKIFQWHWDAVRAVSTLPMLTTFNKVHSDIIAHPAGTVFFAHILAPHDPFAYSADCQLLPLQQWHVRAESRAQTYISYQQQITCVNKQLQLMFSAMQAAGIYDKAIIIVQGDHGSRIALHAPFVANKTQLTQQDFKDYFLTHFAVKSPRYSVAYDKHMYDLQTLLAGVAQSITGQTIPAPVKTVPYIYLLPASVGLPLEKMFITPFN